MQYTRALWRLNPKQRLLISAKFSTVPASGAERALLLEWISENALASPWFPSRPPVSDRSKGVRDKLLQVGSSGSRDEVLKVLDGEIEDWWKTEEGVDAYMLALERARGSEDVSGELLLQSLDGALLEHLEDADSRLLNGVVQAWSSRARGRPDRALRWLERGLGKVELSGDALASVFLRSAAQKRRRPFIECGRYLEVVNFVGEEHGDNFVGEDGDNFVGEDDGDNFVGEDDGDNFVGEDDHDHDHDHNPPKSKPPKSKPPKRNPAKSTPPKSISDLERRVLGHIGARRNGGVRAALVSWHGFRPRRDVEAALCSFWQCARDQVPIAAQGLRCAATCALEVGDGELFEACVAGAASARRGETLARQLEGFRKRREMRQARGGSELRQAVLNLQDRGGDLGGGDFLGRSYGDASKTSIDIASKPSIDIASKPSIENIASKASIDNTAQKSIFNTSQNSTSLPQTRRWTAGGAADVIERCIEERLHLEAWEVAQAAISSFRPDESPISASRLYAACLRLCAYSGREDQALQLQRKFRSLQVEEDAHVFDALVEIAHWKADHQQILALVREMNRRQLDIQPHTAARIVRLFIELGDLKGAARLATHAFPQLPIRPKRSLLATVAHAACEAIAPNSTNDPKSAVLSLPPASVPLESWEKYALEAIKITQTELEKLPQPPGSAQSPKIAEKLINLRK